MDYCCTLQASVSLASDWNKAPELIQYDELSTDQEVADLLLLIAKRWSKISQRTSKPFCPFVYIHGISAERLISIKNIITNSGVNICDGYNYLGAKYNADMMLKKTNYYIGIILLEL